MQGGSISVCETINDRSNSTPRRHILILRPSTSSPTQGRHVTWDKSVVNNEKCGKKKSKICCIYNKQDSKENNDEEFLESNTNRYEFSPKNY